MKLTAQNVYEISSEAHRDGYRQLQELKKLCAVERDMKELADISYALLKSEQALVDLAKEIRMFKEIVDKSLCALWVQSGNPDPIRTEYVTASPGVKMMASLPRHNSDPERYAALMKYLGVKAEFSQGVDGKDLVRPHWPGFVEHLTQLAEQGKPLPPGIDADKTYPVYQVSLRAKKGVME